MVADGGCGGCGSVGGFEFELEGGALLEEEGFDRGVGALVAEVVAVDDLLVEIPLG